MKKKTNLLMRLMMLLMCVATISSFCQTIRIADNNAIRPTGANIYSSLQAAINASTNGDVVYMQPSTGSYGDITLSKQLTILGVGFNILSGAKSTLGTVTVSSSNVTLKGFYMSVIDVTSLSSLNNIIIENVYGGAILQSSVPVLTNLTIRNCFLTSSGVNFLTTGTISGINIYNNIFSGGSLIMAASTSMTNVIVSNNLFYQSPVGGGSTGYCISISNGSNSVNSLILNNLFSGTLSGTSPIAFFNLVGATVNNNIFYGMSPGIGPFGLNSSFGQFQNNSFNNNLATNTTLQSLPPGGTFGSNNGFNNITNQDPQFINATSVYSSNLNYDYNLNTGSPCINAGSDGTDIGPTGGAYPIDQNIKFLPSHLPLITNLATSGVIPQSQPLKMTLHATSN